METNVIKPLPPKKNRIKGYQYIDKNNNIVIWNGNELNCEHNKRKSRCVDCGGSSICEHGKQKRRCKDCGGSSFCEHGKQKTQCKDCCGSSICEHGKRKTYCRDCDGSSFCEHGKRKSYCRDCGGSSFCEHGKQKAHCKDCGGSNFCEHGKQKSLCKDCGGSGICEHGKRKSYCRDCDGSSFCEHGKRKSYCRDCGGSGICEHGKQKARCKDCGGSGICEHGKQKSRCKDCSPESNYFCSSCKYISGSKRYIPSKDTHENLCADCYYYLYPDEKKIPTKYKKKQHFIHEKLQEKYDKDFFKYDAKIECGCSGKIPDWFVDCYNFVLNIECDENQHKGNETSCENKRLCELFLDCNSRPFVCIRFNPDSYKIEEKKIEGCFSFDEKNNIIVNQEEFEKRFELLVEKIDYYLENGSKKDIECIKLFYDESNTKFKM